MGLKQLPGGAVRSVTVAIVVALLAGSCPARADMASLLSDAEQELVSKEHAEVAKRLDELQQLGSALSEMGFKLTELKIKSALPPEIDARILDQGPTGSEAAVIERFHSSWIGYVLETLQGLRGHRPSGLGTAVYEFSFAKVPSVSVTFTQDAAVNVAAAPAPAPAAPPPTATPEPAAPPPPTPEEIEKQRRAGLESLLVSRFRSGWLSRYQRRILANGDLKAQFDRYGYNVADLFEIDSTFSIDSCTGDNNCDGQVEIDIQATDKKKEIDPDGVLTIDTGDQGSHKFMAEFSGSADDRKVERLYVTLGTGLESLWPTE